MYVLGTFVKPPFRRFGFKMISIRKELMQGEDKIREEESKVLVMTILMTLVTTLMILENPLLNSKLLVETK